jgi:hypothetical protein
MKIKIFLCFQRVVIVFHMLRTARRAGAPCGRSTGLEKAAKGLTRKGFPETIPSFTFYCVKLSAQWKRREMVRGVDDGPKTDWLLAALEKTLGLSSVAGASWEY